MNRADHVVVDELADYVDGAVGETMRAGRSMFRRDEKAASVNLRRRLRVSDRELVHAW